MLNFCTLKTTYKPLKCMIYYVCVCVCGVVFAGVNTYTGCLLYMRGRNSSTGKILFNGSAFKSFWAPCNDIIYPSVQYE